MQPPPEAIHTEGSGPDVVFIHGTGRTRSEFPVALLRDRFRITTYDRRGTERWPLADDTAFPTVDEHAGDAGDVIVSRSPGPVHLCGMSFGAVVALELVRRRPELIRSLILFEPPIPPNDDASTVSVDLLNDFKMLISLNQPEQAAELFCRRAMSDGIWEQLPRESQQRCRGMWRHIQSDLSAKAAHRICHRDLHAVHVPVLLLQGERSRDLFKRSILALDQSLPCAQVVTIARAGHYVDLQAWHEFAAVVSEFIARH